MEPFENLKPGMAAERIVTVAADLSVSHTGIPVLGTPMMIGLMEQVSYGVVQPLLPADFTTVGFEVCIKHKGPAFIGDQIKVASTLLEVDGRKLRFDVKVTLGEKVIGEGLHRRTIIRISG